jgi:GR25 family glycosyltransferase involved in LPS biosynthesis
MKAYILYVNDTKSIQYMNTCVESASIDPQLEMIPVEGYNGVDALTLSDQIGIEIIPYYVEKINAGGREHNNAFCCTAGHLKIWQMIVDSGEPGIVLEHDTIIKGPIDLSSLDDSIDILWLGYRIKDINDYTYPSHLGKPIIIPTDRFEGTHAYALTPSGAQTLIDFLKRDGFNDSIDGQLGMRNIFNLKMAILDPTPVVAVIGDKISYIETANNPAQFNAQYTPGFLIGSLKENLLPVRETYCNMNAAFLKSYQDICDKVQRFSNRPTRAMFLAYDDGTIACTLTNDSLRHNDSQAVVIIPQYKIQLNDQSFISKELIPFNLYFSHYYYKHRLQLLDDTQQKLNFALDQHSLDLIFIECSQMDEDQILQKIMWSMHSLKPDGMSIFYTNRFSDDYLTLLKNVGKPVEKIGNFIIVEK